ncbi:MAG TPA: High molecular weight rubredoxin, partial [Nannocystis exedens]|nr:High molecular weight rubredoxin [Nannocystis exedens]
MAARARSPLYMRYRCLVCAHIYDPAEGDPDAG